MLRGDRPLGAGAEPEHTCGIVAAGPPVPAMWRTPAGISGLRDARS